jgi:hypothetical protein
MVKASPRKPRQAAAVEPAANEHELADPADILASIKRDCVRHLHGASLAVARLKELVAGADLPMMWHALCGLDTEMGWLCRDARRLVERLRQGLDEVRARNGKRAS